MSDENAYERDHPYDNSWYANPYDEQTEVNTNTDWLNDQKPVDVDPDGLTGYAKSMLTIQGNVTGQLGDLSLLGSTPSKAWEGHVLAEAAYSRIQMTGNYTELMNYLNHLQIALMNIGMAAQTVADAYSGTDGHSAASLDAVMFAFGDRDAARPSGLPPGLGKTYYDNYFERLSEGRDQPVDPNSALWGDRGSWTERTNADGSVTQVAYGPNGQRMEMTTSNIPGGMGTVTTMVVYAANGTVLSRTSDQTTSYLSGNSVVTDTRTSDAHGPTGSTRETITYGGDGQPVSERTADYDAQGNETGATTARTDDDGSQIITTTRGGEVVREVAVGAQTPGNLTAPRSPAAEALERITND